MVEYMHRWAYLWTVQHINIHKRWKCKCCVYAVQGIQDPRSRALYSLNICSLSLPGFVGDPSRWNSSMCKRKLIWIGAMIKMHLQCQISRKTGRLWEEWEKHCPVLNKVPATCVGEGRVEEGQTGVLGGVAEVGSVGWALAERCTAALCSSQQLLVFAKPMDSLLLSESQSGHTLPLLLWQGTKTGLAKGLRHWGGWLSKLCAIHRERHFFKELVFYVLICSLPFKHWFCFGEGSEKAKCHGVGARPFPGHALGAGGSSSSCALLQITPQPLPAPAACQCMSHHPAFVLGMILLYWGDILPLQRSKLAIWRHRLLQPVIVKV